MKKHGSEVAQENADTARLDWFEANAGDIQVLRDRDGIGLKFAYCTGMDGNGWPTWSEYKSFRETVDAARGAEKTDCTHPKDHVCSLCRDLGGAESAAARDKPTETDRFNIHLTAANITSRKLMAFALTLLQLPADDIVGTPGTKPASLEWYAEKFGYRCGFPALVEMLRNYAAKRRELGDLTNWKPAAARVEPATARNVEVWRVEPSKELRGSSHITIRKGLTFTLPTHVAETVAAAHNASLGATPPEPGLPDAEKALDGLHDELHKMIQCSTFGWPNEAELSKAHQLLYKIRRLSLPASPWIRTAERAPTEKDTLNHRVLTFIKDGTVEVSRTIWYYEIEKRPQLYPFWMPIPPLPASLPTKPTQ